MKFESVIRFVIFVAILSAFVSSFFTFIFLKFDEKTGDELIKDFYFSEVAAHVSPHHIRKAIVEGGDSFVLVDLRSQEEYETEHVVGAVSIPAYANPDKSAYGDVERIVGSFEELIKENPDKDVITYCYSMPCMSAKKIGKLLAENDIYVQTLGIGWNEWRYFWTLWNHPHEWNVTNVEDYLFSGEEQGTFKLNGTKPKVCPTDGAFGC
jgi:rhodanese-related sulfurtransferase